MAQQSKYNILGVKNTVYDCGFCKEEKEPDLMVSFEIYALWLALMRKMKSLEWGGVMEIKDSRIMTFRVPEQEVTSGACEFKEELGGNGIIHSHHNMGAFHSTQDDEQARNLYEYSIVLSSTGYEACRRVKLPCGGYGYRPVTLVIDNYPETGEEKIKERSAVVTGYASTQTMPERWGSAHHDSYGSAIILDNVKDNAAKEFEDNVTNEQLEKYDELIDLNLECPNCTSQLGYTDIHCNVCFNCGVDLTDVIELAERKAEVIRKAWNMGLRD